LTFNRRWQPNGAQRTGLGGCLANPGRKSCQRSLAQSGVGNDPKIAARVLLQEGFELLEHEIATHEPSSSAFDGFPHVVQVILQRGITLKDRRVDGNIIACNDSRAGSIAMDGDAAIARG
jgi:hypothetical protein